MATVPAPAKSPPINASLMPLKTGIAASSSSESFRQVGQGLACPRRYTNRWATSQSRKGGDRQTDRTGNGGR